MFNLLGYWEATTVSEALDLLAGNADLTIIAGGTDLLVQMRGGKLDAANLLSIGKIRSLSNIRRLEDGTLIIGALATFAQIAADPLIKEYIPVLAQAALTVGGPQIRNVATIGGNICNGATSADSAPALLTLNAKLKLESRKETRVVTLEEFYLGPGQVDLRPGELLTEILIAPQDYQGFSAHYIKFAKRSAMDIAIVGIAVSAKIKLNSFEEVRIGLGVAAPTPIRCGDAEVYAKGQPVCADTIAEVGQRAVAAAHARTSWRASKEYREHLVKILTQDALKAAINKMTNNK